jgi:two-component system, chemotaxis family, chemotaxis protein CheY
MKTILIIDDELFMREMIVKMLKEEGLSTICAENGNKAIKLINENVFDLVITDIIMPEKEGLETIIYLKENNPNIPIIAVSGGAKSISSDSLLPIAETLGAKYSFAKPFDIDTFLDAVKDCLGLNEDNSK